MKLARTKNAFRNTVWGAVYRLIALIGPFAIKTIIIKMIGMEYSGLNTLFNSILTVLNLANLGFSSSLVYTMYDAVAKDDKSAICAMLNFFRKIYRLIGLVILGMGICVMPFLPQLVGSECPPDANLYIMFALYLSATVLDYLLFGYVNAIFSAYQREDTRLKIMTVRYIVQYALQIFILAVFKDYYLYLITLPLMVIPNSIANYYAAKKQYPEIYCKGSPDEDIKKGVFHRVKTLFGHKVGNTLMVNIDSILISAFLGLSIQSLYSNYYYIVTAVNGVVEILTGACLAGIGNKLITDTEDENHSLFLNLTYGWVALIGMCAACLVCLFQPFVSGIWIGKEGLLSDTFVIFMTLFFYTWMFRIMQLTYRDAAGLWTKDWLKPYVSMFLKILLSIILVKLTNDIIGVLIPTILIMIFVYFPWEATILYKHQFHRSWHIYLWRIIKYTAINLAGAVACYLICNAIIPDNTALSFFVRLAVICVLFPLLWLVTTYKTDEFRYFKNKAAAIIS
ncbi:MAG: oligosaccharide flippase family protein, partial [Clostridia bacterium]|nr:oligosaccharide flippase family protein [Clostridia bacterium]